MGSGIKVDMDLLDVSSGPLVDTPIGQIADALSVSVCSARNPDRVLQLEASRNMTRKGHFP